MSLIIDINIAHRVLIAEDDPDFGSVRNAIFTTTKTPARVVYGGELGREYERSESLRRSILALDRAGRARKVPDQAVDSETERVKGLGMCQSNDTHIIALAR